MSSDSTIDFLDLSFLPKSNLQMDTLPSPENLSQYCYTLSQDDGSDAAVMNMLMEEVNVHVYHEFELLAQVIDVDNEENNVAATETCSSSVDESNTEVKKDFVKCFPDGSGGILILHFLEKLMAPLIYLNKYHFHTLIPMNHEDLVYCALCEVYLKNDDCNVHVQDGTHKKNICKSRPLPMKLHRNFARQLSETELHCGVCNKIYEESDDHIAEENHKTTMAFAEDWGEVMFVKWCKQFDDKDDSDLKVSESCFTKVSLGDKDIFVIKWYWTMTIRFTHRSYCMLCRCAFPDESRDEHNNTFTHCRRLNRCKLLPEYGVHVIRTLNQDYHHCGICNTFVVVDCVEKHIQRPNHKKFLLNIKRYNAALGNPSFEEYKVQKVEKPKKEKKTEIKEKTTDELKLLSAKVEERIRTKSVKNVALERLAYHTIIVDGNKVSCFICSCVIEEGLVQEHLSLTSHKKQLAMRPYLPSFSFHFIRELNAKWVHCGICNKQLTNSMKHISESHNKSLKHMKLVETLLERTCEKSDPNFIIVTIPQLDEDKNSEREHVSSPPTMLYKAVARSPFTYILTIGDQNCALTLDGWNCIRGYGCYFLCCFVCETLFEPSLKKMHYKSSEHEDSLRKCVVLESYSGHFLRNINMYGHVYCAFCNDIVEIVNISEHITSLHHINRLQASVEYAKRFALSKSIKRINYSEFKKDFSSSSGKLLSGIDECPTLWTKEDYEEDGNEPEDTNTDKNIFIENAVLPVSNNDLHVDGDLEAEKSLNVDKEDLLSETSHPNSKDSDDHEVDAIEEDVHNGMQEEQKVEADKHSYDDKKIVSLETGKDAEEPTEEPISVQTYAHVLIVFHEMKLVITWEAWQGMVACEQETRCVLCHCAFPINCKSKHSMTDEHVNHILKYEIMDEFGEHLLRKRVNGGFQCLICNSIHRKNRNGKNHIESAEHKVLLGIAKSNVNVFGDLESTERIDYDIFVKNNSLVKVESSFQDPNKTAIYGDIKNRQKEISKVGKKELYNNDDKNVNVNDKAPQNNEVPFFKKPLHFTETREWPKRDIDSASHNKVASEDFEAPQHNIVSDIIKTNESVKIGNFNARDYGGDNEIRNQDIKETINKVRNEIVKNKSNCDVILSNNDGHILISMNAWNGIIQTGGANVRCVLCRLVLEGSIDEHINTEDHLNLLAELDVGSNCMRMLALNGQYHCIICNVIVQSNQIENHIKKPNTHQAKLIIAKEMYATKYSLQKSKASQNKRRISVPKEVQATVTEGKTKIKREKFDDGKMGGVTAKKVTRSLTYLIDAKQKPVVETPHYGDLVSVCNGELILVDVDAWNGVLMIDRSLKCVLCSLVLADSAKHITTKEHLKIMMKLEVDSNCIRTLTLNKLYHCIICNVIVQSGQIKNHIKKPDTHQAKLMLAKEKYATKYSTQNSKALRKKKTVDVVETRLPKEVQAVINNVKPKVEQAKSVDGKLGGEKAKKVINTLTNVVDAKQSPVVETQYGDLTFMCNGELIIINVDAWNGILITEGSLKCVLCGLVIEDHNTHKTNKDHLKMLIELTVDSHCVRMLTNPSIRHCIICNVIIPCKGIQNHLNKPKTHSANLNIAIENFRRRHSLIKPLGNGERICNFNEASSSISESDNIFCDVCTIYVPRIAFNQHIAKRSHLDKSLLAKNEEITTFDLEKYDSDYPELPQRDKVTQKDITVNEIVLPPDSGSHFCDICKVQVPKTNIEEHERGHRHQLGMIKLNEKPIVEQQIKNNSTEEVKPSADNVYICKTSKFSALNTAYGLKEGSVEENTKSNVSHNSHVIQSPPSKMTLDCNLLDSQYLCRICHVIVPKTNKMEHEQGNMHKLNGAISVSESLNEPTVDKQVSQLDNVMQATESFENKQCAVKKIPSVIPKHTVPLSKIMSGSSVGVDNPILITQDIVKEAKPEHIAIDNKAVQKLSATIVDNTPKARSENHNNDKTLTANENEFDVSINSDGKSRNESNLNKAICKDNTAQPNKLNDSRYLNCDEILMKNLKAYKPSEVLKNVENEADAFADKTTQETENIQKLLSAENVKLEKKPFKVNDLVEINFESKRILLGSDAWNGIMVSCVLCGLSIDSDQIAEHKRSQLHTKRLEEFSIIDENCIRKIDAEFYYCALCQHVLLQKDLESHILNCQHKKRLKSATYFRHKKSSVLGTSDGSALAKYLEGTSGRPCDGGNSLRPRESIEDTNVCFNSNITNDDVYKNSNALITQEHANLIQEPNICLENDVIYDDQNSTLKPLESADKDIFNPKHETQSLMQDVDSNVNQYIRNDMASCAYSDGIPLLYDIRSILLPWTNWNGVALSVNVSFNTCNLCRITFPRKQLSYHMSSTEHISLLSMLEVNNNGIRKLNDEFYHCLICNKILPISLSGVHLEVRNHKRLIKQLVKSLSTYYEERGQGNVDLKALPTLKEFSKHLMRELAFKYNF